MTSSELYQCIIMLATVITLVYTVMKDRNGKK